MKSPRLLLLFTPLVIVVMLLPTWLLTVRVASPDPVPVTRPLSSPKPTPEPTPAPTPVPTPDPAERYAQAMALLYSRRLRQAAALLEPLGDYADSARWLRYCLRHADDPAPSETLLSEVLYRPKHDHGTLYTVHDAIFYVPDVIDAETAFVFYYPGDTVKGEVPLNVSAAVDYVCDFEPNAVCYFSYYTSSREVEQKNRSSWELAEQLMQACSMVPHKLYIVGTSNGFYTALRLAVQLVREEELPLRCVMSWDAGEDWSKTERLPSDEELALLSEAGVRLELFEQRQFDTGREVIQRLVRAGLPVELIECSDGGHEAITDYAFRLGAISWMLGDISLHEVMYTVTPVTEKEELP